MDNTYGMRGLDRHVLREIESAFSRGDKGLFSYDRGILNGCAPVKCMLTQITGLAAFHARIDEEVDDA